MVRTCLRDSVTIEDLLTHDLGTEGEVLFDGDFYCRQEYLEVRRESTDYIFLIFPVVVAHKEIGEE